MKNTVVLHCPGMTFSQEIFMYKFILLLFDIALQIKLKKIIATIGTYILTTFLVQKSNHRDF